jgi:hypothetical protein
VGTRDVAGAGGHLIRAMHFGHNTNVQVGNILFHVQTEDRGFQHPFIDTTVYSEGRVLHRRTTSYYDVLEMDGDHEQVLQKRVEEQHRGVIEEIRDGTLKLAPPPARDAPAASPAADGSARSQPVGLGVKLLNPNSWLGGGRATLKVQVISKATEAPLEGIDVEARVEGAVTPAVYGGKTAANGEIELAFAMPRLGPDGGALVIRASSEAGQDELRYQLRARPRTPAPADVR